MGDLMTDRSMDGETPSAEGSGVPEEAVARGPLPRPVVPRSSTAVMDEAWYLTAPSEAYRIIVRHLYEQHLAHHYHLSAAQIHEHVRARLPEYTEDHLRVDLAELVRRGNLDEDLELGLANARTVDDFRRRNSMYAITPVTVELEALRVRWENQGRQVGELDGAAIGRLSELLTAVLEAVALPPDHPDRADQVRQRWDDLWSRFEPMSRSANAYIGNMRRQERELLADLGAFQEYKKTLIHYLTRFIEGLAEHRDRFWRVLSALDAEDLVRTLVAGAVASTKAFEDRGHLERQYRQQVAALTDWFAPHGDAEVLQGHASRAIEQVSRAARRLAETQVGAVSRSQELLALARAFGACRDVRQAERLAAAAFGLVTPRHWELVLPEYVSENPHNPVWRAAPVDIPLQRRRTYGERHVESPVEVAAHEARRQAIRERARHQEQEVVAFLHRLFATGPVRLGALGELGPHERDLLLSWVNDCLTNGGQARTETGVVLAIENPEERSHVWLRATDGDLLVPDYRIVRVEEEAADGPAIA